MGGRLMFQALIGAAVMVLAANDVYSQTEEQNAYCGYVMQQALAQRNLLRTPEAVSGMSHANIGIPPQLYFGISDSLANYGKAKLTMDAARKDCESYRATAEATVHIQYALPRCKTSRGRRSIRCGQFEPSSSPTGSVPS
jgi:hypothetical protein